METGIPFEHRETCLMGRNATFFVFHSTTFPIDEEEHELKLTAFLRKRAPTL